MRAEAKVNFFFSGSTTTIRNRTKLKRFIVSIFRREKTRIESISFIFTNDKVLYDINKTYLNHSYYTDVITFDLSGRLQPKTAEVYISVERVRDNSQIHGTNFKQELHRVIFHAVLHLCGYNDRTQKQKAQIRKKENQYLALFFP